MSRRLDGSDRGFLITGEAAGRIAKAINQADNARRSVKAPKLRTAYDDEGPRLGTINATWTKGQTATVTKTKADGTAISPAETFTATNHFATVTVSSGTKKVLCVLVDDLWLLVAAEC